MADMSTTTNRTESSYPSFWDEAVEKCQQMMQRYWEEHPDIYRIVQQKKEQAAALASAEKCCD